LYLKQSNSTIILLRWSEHQSKISLLLSLKVNIFFSINLHSFPVDDKKLHNYFTNFPFISYFINLSCYLRDIWVKIDETLAESNIQNHSKLTELLDDQYDLLMYIDDVFQLQKEKINTVLANCLLHYAIIPALLVPFTSSKRVYLSLKIISSLSHRE